MKIVTKTWLGLIVALSALGVAKPVDARQNPVPSAPDTVLETRLARIAATLKLREQQSPEAAIESPNPEIAGWLKGRRGGWVNGRRGSFLNRRRRWSDGGGFFNRRGGGFLNRR